MIIRFVQVSAPQTFAQMLSYNHQFADQAIMAQTWLLQEVFKFHLYHRRFSLSLCRLSHLVIRFTRRKGESESNPPICQT